MRREVDVQTAMIQDLARGVRDMVQQSKYLLCKHKDLEFGFPVSTVPAVAF